MILKQNLILLGFLVVGFPGIFGGIFPMSKEETSRQMPGGPGVMMMPVMMGGGNMGIVVMPAGAAASAASATAAASNTAAMGLGQVQKKPDPKPAAAAMNMKMGIAPLAINSVRLWQTFMQGGTNMAIQLGTGYVAEMMRLVVRNIFGPFSQLFTTDGFPTALYALITAAFQLIPAAIRIAAPLIG